MNPKWVHAFKRQTIPLSSISPAGEKCDFKSFYRIIWISKLFLIAIMQKRAIIVKILHFLSGKCKSIDLISSHRRWHEANVVITFLYTLYIHWNEVLHYMEIEYQRLKFCCCTCLGVLKVNLIFDQTALRSKRSYPYISLHIPYILIYLSAG